MTNSWDTPVRSPPEGVTSNLINPSSIAGHATACNIVCAVVVIILVVLRMYTRIFVVKSVGCDDCMLSYTNDFYTHIIELTFYLRHLSTRPVRLGGDNRRVRVHGKVRLGRTPLERQPSRLFARILASLGLWRHFLQHNHHVYKAVYPGTLPPPLPRWQLCCSLVDRDNLHFGVLNWRHRLFASDLHANFSCLVRLAATLPVDGD